MGDGVMGDSQSPRGSPRLKKENGSKIFFKSGDHVTAVADNNYTDLHPAELAFLKVVSNPPFEL